MKLLGLQLRDPAAARLVRLQAIAVYSRPEAGLRFLSG